MYKIAIIGSGPTGIYTAQQLLLQGVDLSITIFESQAEAGKGTPYHQDWNEKEMLSNIASIEIPPIHETLVQWLVNLTDFELAKMGIARAEIDERAFFPRVALGRYFQVQLNELIKNAAGTGCVLNVKSSHKVLDVSVIEDGVMLAINDDNDDLINARFDYVVMATGHAWPKNTEIRPGYFLSPWPASCLKTIRDCHVGIRGTSLSAIDAAVALSTARGVFLRNEAGQLNYLPEPGTEAFRITMLSRKGVLPEADFYYPMPYRPLAICSTKAVDSLIAQGPAQLLDKVYALFKAELAACDPAYAKAIGLHKLSLDNFASAYFALREQNDPFEWAERNLSEAKANYETKHVVEWRYAILRMHEAIARVVPILEANDYERFSRSFKSIFSDCYATVPHESIERILALNRTGKLEVLKAGDDYVLDSESSESGAILQHEEQRLHYPAFIEAMGQHVLSLHEFPFPTLWEQGFIQKATASQYMYRKNQWMEKIIDVGGIALDRAYHPVSALPDAERLYCLSLPFLLGQFPFAQGITSSYDMGKKAAEDIKKQLSEQTPVLVANDSSHQPVAMEHAQ